MKKGYNRKPIRQSPSWYKRRERAIKHHSRKDAGSSYCYFCGGQMTWCDTCQMWSSNCCQDYGTCLCS